MSSASPPIESPRRAASARLAARAWASPECARKTRVLSRAFGRCSSPLSERADAARHAAVPGDVWFDLIFGPSFLQVPFFVFFGLFAFRLYPARGALHPAPGAPPPRALAWLLARAGGSSGGLAVLEAIWRNWLFGVFYVVAELCVCTDPLFSHSLGAVLGGV